MRWYERRTVEYAAFSSAAKRTMSVLFRIAAGHSLDDATEPITIEDARPLLASAFHQREEAFERVRLVGSIAVIAAARGWVQQIYILRGVAERVGVSRDDWQEQVAATNRKRDEFYAVARLEIGLDSQPSTTTTKRASSRWRRLTSVTSQRDT